MKRIASRRRIAAPTRSVWELLADFGNVSRFNPLVRESRLLEEEGKGTVRQCDLYDGSKLVEEVVYWDDGRKFEVNIRNVPFPVKKARAFMQVESDGNGGSIASMGVSYRTRGGPLAWLMGALLLQPLMRIRFRRVLAGLEHTAITGEPVANRVPAFPIPHGAQVASA